MSPEKQRFEIGKVCGWVDKYGYYPKLPDYLNDLNAIHQAIKSLNEEQRYLYIVQLKGMLGSVDAVDATASQRAEAFLVALGLWEEEE